MRSQWQLRCRVQVRLRQVSVVDTLYGSSVRLDLVKRTRSAGSDARLNNERAGSDAELKNSQFFPDVAGKISRDNVKISAHGPHNLLGYMR